jgi:hypothetical protein
VKQAYRVLAGLIALGVLVQAAAIAFGWFDALNEMNNGAVIDENYEYNLGQILHAIVGMIVMPVLGLALLGVSFPAAKTVPGAPKWAGIVLGLIVLQIALAFAAFAAPVVGALHGINALAILGTATRAQMLTKAGAIARRQDDSPVTLPAQTAGPSAPESSRSV